MIHQSPALAIRDAKKRLYYHGSKTKQAKWQSSKSPDDIHEILHYSFGFVIPSMIGQLREDVKPNLPWAEEQFQERVAGKPLNPGVTFKDWPYFKNFDDTKHRIKDEFSHTYMERFWPKQANKVGIGLTNMGIRHAFGDYQDMLNLLRKDPSTRQAYLPIYFPEDTGTHHRDRVPCTLGYDFIMRNNKLDITYYIRSCDFIRHFRDDIYMACRLVYDIIGKIGWRGKVTPGIFNMHIKSFHVFNNEKELLKMDKT